MTTTTLQENIVVQRSLADCFRYVSDFSTVEQWDPGVFRSEKITPGPLRVGTQFDVLLNVGGRESPMRYEITEIVADRCVVLRGTGDNLVGVDTIWFDDIGGGQTKIVYRAELTFAGIAGAVQPLLGPLLNRIGKAAVTGLKDALTVKTRAPRASVCARAADTAVLPAAINFTRRGYHAMPDKSLSEFMDGKTVAITGPTSGLGLAAACEFARLGADLVLIGRNREKLEVARRRIADFSGRNTDHMPLLLADLSLVAEAQGVADELRVLTPQLDVLVNNAGALFNERQLTAEGNEQSLAINLLGPWVLVESLMSHLTACRTHVINVVSGGMYLQGLRLRDMQFATEDYDGPRAYARAKRGLVALTEHWAEKYRRSGVRFNSMHPGWAKTPGVDASLPAFSRRLDARLRDARMGADTIVWLGSAAAVGTETGKLWFDRVPRSTTVIPGTGVGKAKRGELVNWLVAHTGIGEPVQQPPSRRRPARTSALAN